MTKTEYRKYICSEKWQKRRKVFLNRFPYMACYRCFIGRDDSRKIYDQDLHVHHASYEHVGNGAEPDDDLAALCRRCHEIETFGKSDIPAPKQMLCGSCYREKYFGIDVCDACLWEEYRNNIYDPPGELLEGSHGLFGIFK